MPNFKKSSGFKMNGYSYPGQSPMKGKKANQLAAAAERKASATSAIEDFATLKGEATNLLEGTNVKYGEISSPATKRAPLKQQPVGSFSTQQKLEGNLVPNQELMSKDVSAPKESMGSKMKGAVSKFASSSAGQAAGEALATGLVNLGISALKPKAKKEKRRVNPAAGFSQIKIGRS